MSTTAKWVIASVVLLALGAVVFGISFASAGFDPRRLSAAEYETEEVGISGPFRNISVESAAEKVVLAPSEDGKCTVRFTTEKHTLREASVSGDTLTIRTEERGSWSDRIGFFLRNTVRPEITVYLPGDAYDALTVSTGAGDLKVPEAFSFGSISVAAGAADMDLRASVSGPVVIEAGTGDISLIGLTAEEIRLAVATGDVTMNSVECGSLTVKAVTGDIHLDGVTCTDAHFSDVTGDITLRGVVASGDMDIALTTGDVRFDASDAASITAKLTTGDVKGTLLSDKVFISETGTGDVDVPKTASGGTCSISVGTGDIDLEIR